MEIKNRQLGTTAKLVGTILPVLIIIAVLAFNSTNRQALFIMGVNQVYNMQRSGSNFVNFIENVFSLFGNPIFVILFLGLQVLFVKELARKYVHLIYFLGSLYFMALIKQIFQQSRPFWYSTQVDINQWFCPTDFGNPSGHSFAAVLLYEPLLSDILGLGPKKVMLYVWSVLVVMVMISRMYLGAHSLDQIILGCVLGFSFLIIYKYKVQELLYQVISNILNKHSQITYFVLTSIIGVFFMLVAIIVFILNTQNRRIDGALINRINQACGKSLTEDTLREGTFMATIVGFVSIGMMYGILLLENSQRWDSFQMVGLWRYSSHKSAVLHILITFLIAGIPTVVLVVLLPSLIKVTVLKYVLKCVGSIWGGFGLVYFWSVMGKKYNFVIAESASLSR